MGRRAGQRVRRNGARRATHPRICVAGIWPVSQDDRPPDFILHVLSRGVINVNYCTYCTSEQTPGQPMSSLSRYNNTMTTSTSSTCHHRVVITMSKRSHRRRMVVLVSVTTMTLFHNDASQITLSARRQRRPRRHRYLMTTTTSGRSTMKRWLRVACITPTEMGVTKHRTGPKDSAILHSISSKSNKMQVRNATATCSFS